VQRHRPRKKFFSRLNINDIAGKTDGFAISIFHQDPRNMGVEVPRRLPWRWGRKGKAERGRLWKGRERVLYKTARDITSNIRKTDSPAAASSRAHPPVPSSSLPPISRSLPWSAVVMRWFQFWPRGAHPGRWCRCTSYCHVNVQVRGNDCARLIGGE